MKKPIDNKIICIGAGGSTKVILDIIRERNNNKIIGILDDDESLYGNDFNGIKIIGKITCSQGGHKLTNQLLREVFQNKDNFSVIEIKEKTIPHLLINRKYLRSIA